MKLPIELGSLLYICEKCGESIKLIKCTVVDTRWGTCTDTAYLMSNMMVVDEIKLVRCWGKTPDEAIEKYSQYAKTRISRISRDQQSAQETVNECRQQITGIMREFPMLVNLDPEDRDEWIPLGW